MRLIDISAAAVIGLISASVILAWSPSPYEASVHRYALETDMRNILVSVVSNEGITTIQDSDFAGLCNGLASYSNSTVTVSAMVGQVACLAGPPPGAVVAYLQIPLPSGPVTLEAWQNAGQ